jgi:hypothetical protein
VHLVLFCALWDEAPQAPLHLTGDIMTTRRATSVVSVAARLGRVAVLAVGLGTVACAGGPRPVTRGTYAERTDGFASTDEPDAGPAAIEFDNEATVHVDIYIVSAQYQWRLGRVVPGARALLRVPQSAIESTMGLVWLTVIPGSQMSAQAAWERGAVLAMPQPVAQLLSQRWTFRQSATAATQLQGTTVRPTFTR